MESGKTYVNVAVANKTLLEDSNTKYPITIDPTINDWDTIKDTFISSSQPDTSYSSITSMYTQLPSYRYTRSLAQFILLLDSYTYSYDANSNITSVVTNTGTISYQYNDLKQLTQETLLKWK